ncbi:hypothetical protein L462_04753 [Enterobacter sp. BIDMC 26]|nr:hypothetical protein L462_04753 [Enterobacter sp. BIDMC 26]
MSYEINGREIISNVLLNLKEELLPHLPIACKTCPMAMWQVHNQGKEIKSYCRVMHAYTWQTSKPTEILDCDALYEEPEEEEELLQLQNNNVNLQQPPVEARYEPWGDMHEDDQNYS